MSSLKTKFLKYKIYKDKFRNLFELFHDLNQNSLIEAFSLIDH